VDFATGLQATL